MAQPDSCSKRITFKRTRPNPLFQEWLEELYEEAKAKNSKLVLMLKNALASLSKYPLPLQSGADCAILEGFNKKLCLFLDQRLEVFKDSAVERSDLQSTSTDISKSNNSVCKTTESIPKSACSGIEPKVSQNSSTASTNSNESNNENLDKADNNKISAKPRSRKKYKPTFRSGGYAILVALLEFMNENPGKPSLNKEQLIDRAQKHSDESFIRPKPESFYTAWSNMTRLITKGLVNKNGSRKAEYSLSNVGVLLTKELLEDAENIPTTNDVIFNNAIPSNLVAPTVLTDNLTNGFAGTCDNIQSVERSNNNSYIEMLAGTFDIILLIDKNETGGVTKRNDPTVAQFNKYPNLKHEYRSLKVGDFTWIARSKQHKDLELVLPYVVERKRMDDLGHSIKDGRFHEQKFRLRKCGLKNVIYLIENFGSNKHLGLPLQSLMQALANTRVQDGFKIYVTDSLTNSTRFLAIMSKRLTVEFKDKNLKGHSSEPSGEELMAFSYFNQASLKTKKLTVTETFIKILLQLKGLSVEKALAITKEYPTPKSLITKYKSCDSKQGELLLATLKYDDTKRNVGVSVSKSIYQLFSNKDLM